MDFEHAGKLWDLFKCLRAPTLKYMERENGDIDAEDVEEMFGFYIPETVVDESAGMARRILC